MTMNEYLHSRGLKSATVAQECKVSRQAIEQLGKSRNPTVKTMKKIAQAMTVLGAPTTVVDLTKAIYGPEEVNDRNV